MVIDLSDVVNSVTWAGVDCYMTEYLTDGSLVAGCAATAASTITITSIPYTSGGSQIHLRVYASFTGTTSEISKITTYTNNNLVID